MARAVVQFTFAALLALLSMHGVVSSPQVIRPSIVVFSAAVKRQVSRETRPAVRVRRVPLIASSYVSRSRPEPDGTALFQRPPPVFLFFS